MLTNSRVFTNDGVKYMSELKSDNIVLTSDGTYEKIYHLRESGFRKTMKIDHQNGHLILPTHQKIAILEDVFGNYIWKNAIDIKPDDRILFLTYNVEGNKTQLPTYEHITTSNRNSVNITIPELDTDMSWFFGQLHGDGCVQYKPNNKAVYIAYSSEFEGNRNKILNQLKRFGINASDKKIMSDKYGEVCAYSKQLAEYLYRYKQPNSTIKIPKFISRGDIEIKMSYLSGLFDADGYAHITVIYLVTTVYKEYAEEVQSLLASCGIPSTIRLRKKDTRGNRKRVYDVTISGIDETKAIKKYLEIYSLRMQHSLKQSKFRISSKDSGQYSVPKSFLENIKIPKKMIGIDGISIKKLKNYVTPTLPYIPIKIKNVSEYFEMNTITFECDHGFVSDGFLFHSETIPK